MLLTCNIIILFMFSHKHYSNNITAHPLTIKTTYKQQNHSSILSDHKANNNIIETLA